MDSWLPPLIVVAVGVAFVKAIAWWIAEPSYARWALQRAENTAIAKLRHGTWAKVTGVVSAVAPTTRSPVGEQDCIGFRLEVRRTDRQVLRIVLRKERWGVFSIADETGTVEIAGPFFFGIEYDGGWKRVPQPRLTILEKAGVPIPAAWFGPPFAYREAVLRPGDRVSVLGLAFLELDPTEPAAGFRSPRLAASIRGSSRRPVIVAAADEQARG